MPSASTESCCVNCVKCRCANTSSRVISAKSAPKLASCATMEAKTAAGPAKGSFVAKTVPFTMRSARSSRESPFLPLLLLRSSLRALTELRLYLSRNHYQMSPDGVYDAHFSRQPRCSRSRVSPIAPSARLGVSARRSSPERVQDPPRERHSPRRCPREDLSHLAELDQRKRTSAHRSCDRSLPENSRAPVRVRLRAAAWRRDEHSSSAHSRHSVRCWRRNRRSSRRRRSAARERAGSRAPGFGRVPSSRARRDGEPSASRRAAERQEEEAFAATRIESEPDLASGVKSPRTRGRRCPLPCRLGKKVGLFGVFRLF